MSQHSKRLLVGLLAVAGLAVIVYVGPRSTSAPGADEFAIETSDERPAQDSSVVLAEDRGPAEERTFAPEKDSGDIYHLEVTDLAGDPVGGASVLREGPSGWQAIGVTDGEGQVQVEVATGFVRHPRFMPQEFHLDDDRTHAVVRLRPGGVIEGEVSGVHARQATVAARLLTASMAEHSVLFERAHPRAGISQVDDRGRFRIEGLELDEVHHLEAVAPGAVSAGATTRAGTYDDPVFVMLELQALWGGLVRFVGPGGAPLGNSPLTDLRRSKPGTYFTPVVPPGFRHASGVTGIARHRLADGLALDFAEGEFRVLVAWQLAESAPSPAPEALDCVFEFHLPGYRPVAGMFRVEALASALVETRVELVPEVDDWGALTLEVTGTDYLPAPPPREWPEYALLLESGSQVLAYTLSAPLGGRTQVVGIPAGTYSARLEALGKFLRIDHAGGELLVGSGVETTAHFDLSTHGSIEIVCVNPDGTTFNEQVVVTAIAETEPGSGVGEPSQYSMLGPPYVVRHLPPGPYWLWLERPASQKYVDPNATIPDTVYVGESSISTAVFELE